MCGEPWPTRNAFGTYPPGRFKIDAVITAIGTGTTHAVWCWVKTACGTPLKLWV